jgi:hypothetical protein
MLLGITEEKTQCGIIYPIGDLKSPIRYTVSNWGLGICSIFLFKWTQKSQSPIGYTFPNRGFVIAQLGYHVQLGYFLEVLLLDQQEIPC